MTWGDLRDGISVALASALPNGPGRELAITITHAVVLFSILVQGLTVPALVKHLLNKPAPDGPPVPSDDGCPIRDRNFPMAAPPAVRHQGLLNPTIFELRSLADFKTAARLRGMIDVKHIGGDEWTVAVHGAVMTHHRVRLPNADLARLSEGRAAQELLRESFRFLLEREPNTSILSSFDLPLIGRYFPEYEQEIRARLRKS
jgi:hypothetical protein